MIDHPPDEPVGHRVDHRTLPRRRGRALDDAILCATMAEIAEVGYQDLSLERVAERASTGKASLYRRWPGKVELVLAALRHHRPAPADGSGEGSGPIDTGSLRGDLLAVLGEAAASLDGPAGAAVRGLLSDILRDPALATQVRALARGTILAAIREAVRRAHDRGEIDAGGITTRQLDAGPAMLRFHFLTHPGPVPSVVITEIVDEVVLPLLTGVRHTVLTTLRTGSDA